MLFNLHRVLEVGEGSMVVLVEGYFDCFTVHQAGFPNVVSLMGSALSDHQEKLIIDHFGQVVLILDGDDGGRAAASEIASRLTRKLYVRVLDVPDNTQPDRLPSGEIQSLLFFLSPVLKEGNNGTNHLHSDLSQTLSGDSNP